MNAQLACVLALVGTACVGSSAFAQTAGGDARASKWERAKLQIETVCRDHEAKQRFDLAAQCYDEVTAMLSAVPPAAPRAPAVAEQAPVPPARPAARMAQRKPAPVAAPRIVRRPEPKPARVAVRHVPRPVIAMAPIVPEFRPVRPFRQYVLLGIGY